jgi:hypothetical protein
LKDIAPGPAAGSSFVGRGRIAAGAMAFAAVTAFALLGSSPALAASAPPTITSAFTPNEIGVGDSTASALSITITNTNTKSISAVLFSDTLPAGLTIDNPAGENGTCGSAGVITANPGSSTFSLSGGSVKASTFCTISVSLIASQAGTFKNSTGLVSSSAGSSSTGDTESVTVLPPPTLTVAKIKNNAKYAYGQTVKPTYTCTQPVDPTALEDCSAVDDLGNSIGSGGALKTKDPGKHTLSVTSTSTDGLSTEQDFNYTVLPDNRFTVSHLQAKKGGSLAFQLRLPGAGAVKVVGLAPKNVTFAKYNGKVGQLRTLKLTIEPTPAAKKLLTPPASKTASTRVKLKLTITYTPKGGVKKTVTKHVTAVSSK